MVSLRLLKAINAYFLLLVKVTCHSDYEDHEMEFLHFPEFDLQRWKQSVVQVVIKLQESKWLHKTVLTLQHR